MTFADRLAGIDAFLLDRVFQPLADRLGERPAAFDIGVSLELGAVVLKLAADASLFAIGQLGWTAGLWDGFSCACGMWFYVFMVRQRPMLLRPDRINPLRLVYRSLRLLALGFAIWSAIATAAASGGPGTHASALNALSNVAFVAAIYLISCQPRPPGWRLAERRRRLAGLPAPSFT